MTCMPMYGYYGSKLHSDKFTLMATMALYKRKAGSVVVWLVFISAGLFNIFHLLSLSFNIKERGLPRSVISSYDNIQLNLAKEPWLSAPQLPRALIKAEHDEAIQLLKDFSELLSELNMTFLMTHGTLLGSFMTHDILPWDDDLDAMISCSDLPKLRGRT